MNVLKSMKISLLSGGKKIIMRKELNLREESSI